MTQYCRYCNNLYAGNGTWCSLKEKEIKESAAKRPNRCKGFDFNPMDAFFETEGYKPRHKKNSGGEQIAIAWRCRYE